MNSNSLSPLQRYFDYGRSIEAKLRRDAGPTGDLDAPIIKAGWIPTECDRSTFNPPNGQSVDVYGMSFSAQIADEMAALDPDLKVQKFGGPAAPPNHSYACFLNRLRTNKQLAPFQLMGILASSLARIDTISGLTTSFEAPEPFTYPRFSVSDEGTLSEYMPPITTQADLHKALANPALWENFVQELKAHDDFYDPFLFRADFVDMSTIGRLIRRAWAQRELRIKTAAMRPIESYVGAPDIPAALRVILLDFAAQARAAKLRPMIILIEDKGYGGTLSKIASDELRSHGIWFLSTSSLISSEDSGNFLPDGHFTTAANKKIAGAVLDALAFRRGGSR